MKKNVFFLHEKINTIQRNFIKAYSNRYLFKGFINNFYLKKFSTQALGCQQLVYFLLPKLHVSIWAGVEDLYGSCRAMISSTGIKEKGTNEYMFA